MAVAFLLGFAARLVGLPPLIGFLAGGFVLNFMGYEATALLLDLSDVGVGLLLFAIGLKLDVRSLLRPSIWAGSSVHMLITVVVFTGLLKLLAFLAGGLTGVLDWQSCLLIAFALSFSSTVFAVKAQEDQGSSEAAYAKVAIGILIMQDIFAVIFLTASKGTPPSAWSVLVIAAMLLGRPLLHRLLDKAGHGELLILMSLLIPLGSSELFELVKLKGDLGALFIGILIAGHGKANEMAKTLLSFKDLFLVGFFLSIGLKATPTWNAVFMSLLLLLAMPFKVGLFLILLTRFKLLARNALLASLGLATYSEFGLIIGNLCADKGWLGGEWLATFAILVALSFVLAAPLNRLATAIYKRYEERLKSLETIERLPEDIAADISDAKVVVFGMGRVGRSAYDELQGHYPGAVVGVDVDQQVVDQEVAAGRRVVRGDATDSEFWQGCHAKNTVLIMLTMPRLASNLHIAEELRERGFRGRLGSTARFDDEVEALREAGVDLAFNLYSEAGAGFVASAVAEVQSTGVFAKDELLPHYMR